MLSRRERRALKHGKGALRHLAKLDVWTLEKREREAETRSFEQDGASFTLTLRTPDTADFCAAQERAKELIETHVTGAGGQPPYPFPGGVKLTEALAALMANVYEMQCPESPADRFELVELIQLADKLPEAWAEAQVWIGQLMARWESRLGNGRAAR